MIVIVYIFIQIENLIHIDFLFMFVLF